MASPRQHVNAAQNHTKANYMRNPPAAEIFNEEVANAVNEIKATLVRLDELSIAFDYEGKVTAQDAEEILAKIVSLHQRASIAADAQTSSDRLSLARY